MTKPRFIELRGYHSNSRVLIACASIRKIHAWNTGSEIILDIEVPNASRVFHQKPSEILDLIDRAYVGVS